MRQGCCSNRRGLAPNVFVPSSSCGTRCRVDEGSILEDDIRIDASLRFPIGDNAFHLQLELPGDRGIGIPEPTILANDVQNVGGVGTTIWFPIPALSQKHPDRIRNPWRCGARGSRGSFPVLYLRQHLVISAPTKWDLAG